MNIFIVGLPGVGKSYLGTQLSAHLGLEHIDLDRAIEEKVGMTIPEIFEKQGEDVFRNVEAEVLRESVHDSPAAVISTGGGTPCYNDNLSFMMENGVSVYLTDEFSHIAQRLISDGANRPLITSQTQGEVEADLVDLWTKRRSYYEQTQVITGFQAIQHLHLLTNRLELFTKPG